MVVIAQLALIGLVAVALALFVVVLAGRPKSLYLLFTSPVCRLLVLVVTLNPNTLNPKPHTISVAVACSTCKVHYSGAGFRM